MKLFQTSSKKTLGGLENMHFACPDNHFWRTYEFKKLIGLKIFRDIKRKKCRKSDRKFPAGLSKLRSSLPEGHCQRENIFWELISFLFFGRWAKNARPFSKSFWAGLWKLHSTCPRNIFGRIFSEVYISVLVFWGLEQNFLDF